MSGQSVKEQAAMVRRLSLIRPMRFRNVPAINARYWTAMTLASMFGCNTGDDFSYYAGWNHWIGLGPLALIFVALALGERRFVGQNQAWYWAVVIVLRTAATNLADLATHTFALPYSKVILGLAVLQAPVIWRVTPRLLALQTDKPGRPAADGWYWLSLLTAGTLGTAAGDWVAEGLHLGTGYGTVMLGAISAVFLVWGSRARWTTKGSYWLAVIAVRTAERRQGIGSHSGKVPA